MNLRVGRGTFEELVRSRYREVWRYLRFLGASTSSADDLTQETFLAFLRKPGALRDPDAAGAYLRVVARNLFLKSLRGKAAEALPEDVEAYADDLAWEACLRALEGCVEALDERSRRALEWLYGEGAERAAIGERLGLDVEGVKTLLRRARERVRTCVERKLSHE